MAMAPTAALSGEPTSTSEQIEILAAFSKIPDSRHSLGKRHHIALCLALFTLAIAAGNQGFLAIGDWLKSYQTELIELVQSAQTKAAFLQYYPTGVVDVGLQTVLICFGSILQG